MWDRPDNQEVGLEAATLERVRNSSLVKWSCADDVTGLKHDTEAAGSLRWLGRGGQPQRSRPRDREGRVMKRGKRRGKRAVDESEERMSSGVETHRGSGTT